MGFRFYKRLGALLVSKVAKELVAFRLLIEIQRFAIAWAP